MSNLIKPYVMDPKLLFYPLFNQYFSFTDCMLEPVLRTKITAVINPALSFHQSLHGPGGYMDSLTRIWTLST